MKTIKDHKVYSVSEVNYFAKQTLENLIIWVEGEVSSFRKNPNWSFYYLDLKDDNANLPCITSGSVVEKLEGDILNQKVIAFGNLTVYEPTGKYQLRIQHIELSGEGDLYKRLEELVRKLRQEGLFDPTHKKDIPLYPKRVGLVTSSGSDAWNDFVSHTVEKFPIIELINFDIRVQGVSAVKNLLSALPIVDSQDLDVAVITRGGGSLEDLAAFNSEEVARAIFKMKTPTVVAIGHEANESLAEWVADRRASTPTDAANIVTQGWQTVLDRLFYIEEKLSTKQKMFTEFNLQRLDTLYSQLLRSKLKIEQYPHILGTLKETLRRHEKILINDAREKEKMLFSSLNRESESLILRYGQKLKDLDHSIGILSPENTLKRGYSMTTDKNGKIIKDIDDVVVGDIVGVKLQRGTINSQVKSKGL